MEGEDEDSDEPRSIQQPAGMAESFSGSRFFHEPADMRYSAHIISFWIGATATLETVEKGSEAEKAGLLSGIP